MATVRLSVEEYTDIQLALARLSAMAEIVLEYHSHECWVRQVLVGAYRAAGVDFPTPPDSVTEGKIEGA